MKLRRPASGPMSAKPATTILPSLWTVRFHTCSSMPEDPPRVAAASGPHVGRATDEDPAVGLNREAVLQVSAHARRCRGHHHAAIAATTSLVGGTRHCANETLLAGAPLAVT